jgi:hypothetical protein
LKKEERCIECTLRLLRHRHIPRLDEQQALAQMEQAARDPQFLADLYQTMNDFAAVDAEWWEPAG